MQHFHNLLYLSQLLRGHRQPVVEGLGQFRADLLPRGLTDVVEWLQQHLWEKIPISYYRDARESSV